MSTNEQEVINDHSKLEPFEKHQDAMWAETQPRALAQAQLGMPGLRGAGLRGAGVGVIPPPSANVVKMDVACGMPYLRRGAPANAFKQLRSAVREKAGLDFLARCADMMRPRNYESAKPGVANRSRHKCGDAFDYDQSSGALVIVREPQGMDDYFRTYLRCAKQDGSLGVNLTLKDVRGMTVKGFYFDFTREAERYGWKRIKAWRGWSLKGSGYNLMEFWHYQLTEGLSFDEAMAFLYAVPKPAVVKDVRKPNISRVLGLNDRGMAVYNLQEKLNLLGLLPLDEVDGVFGMITRAAVLKFQEQHDTLDDDGLVGPETRQMLELTVERLKGR